MLRAADSDGTGVGHVFGADQIDVVEPGNAGGDHRPFVVQRQRQHPQPVGQRAVDLFVVEQRINGRRSLRRGIPARSATTASARPGRDGDSPATRSRIALP